MAYRLIDYVQLGKAFFFSFGLDRLSGSPTMYFRVTEFPNEWYMFIK